LTHEETHINRVRCAAGHLARHLAQVHKEVDWRAVLDMSKYVGKMAVLAMSDLTDSPGLALIEGSNEERYFMPLYDEALRPQFHFSQRLGWNNDVNGLVYENGEWHLYFQYCPVALYHADKHWGHAVSKDLVHWEELPIALYPVTQAKVNEARGGGLLRNIRHTNPNAYIF
jgi:hypothetical protein